MRRRDGRRPKDARTLGIELNPLPYAEGSCLLSAGHTRVLCAATVQDSVPDWKAESGGGWVTAEYAMLPRSTHSRTSRERTGPGGRTQEIQRLIGRSLRAVVDLDRLGPRTLILDCDVLQADGGTRTAAITGASVALALACRHLVTEEMVVENPMREMVAAVSVGILEGVLILDLDYSEDSRAQVDLNLVATETGSVVEVQGTAEGAPFSRGELLEMIDLGMGGIRRLVDMQRSVLEE